MSGREVAACTSGWQLSAESEARQASAPCDTTVSAPRRDPASFSNSDILHSYTYSTRRDFGLGSNA